MPRTRGGASRPGIVHRIDKDTSGVLVVAKEGRTREGLKQQLQAHAVERLYQGITRGVPVGATIDTLHARHPRARLRFTSRALVGRRAVTHLAVREPLAGGRAALVECRLETGRTHQIRVHLAEQTRTPLLGDALYGGAEPDEELARVANELGRHALHAMVLGFRHPIAGEPMRFVSPLPEDLALALATLRELAPRPRSR
ncbi:RluA family pseudouridine synthase [Myxococcota bacterium]